MLYPYITFNDNTEVLHTHVLEEGTQNQSVEVHFERPVLNGFQSARCVIPGYKWLSNDGYSEDEIKNFEKFLKNNAHLMFEFARKGGVCSA